ncbi:MAG: hypothetical protein U5K76_01525 [Woeseiaceae bacterium]|nr:hypothetical protein [Woeseiaceae bacterium]
MIDESAAAWATVLESLAAQGVRLEPRDLSVLDDVAALLYSGPWVAERYAAIRQFITDQPDSMHDVVRDIILGGSGATRPPTRFSVSTELARTTDVTWMRQCDGCDGLLVSRRHRAICAIEDVLAQTPCA